ncbi:MAG TPA: hypothetical protein VFH28_05790 [Nitrososphaera sp.]|nr:hypothetical protein [Nitrososphaera sp.]
MMIRRIMNQMMIPTMFVLSTLAITAVATATTTTVYADHHAAARDKNFQEYCVNYQYIGQPPNPLNVQCEPTRQACDQRLAEYQAREDLEPTSDCYKHEKEYVNFSEHSYLRQYQR